MKNLSDVRVIQCFLAVAREGNVPERIGRDELDAGYHIGDINAGAWKETGMPAGARSGA